MMLIHKICIGFSGDGKPKTVDSVRSSSAAIDVDNCETANQGNTKCRITLNYGFRERRLTANPMWHSIKGFTGTNSKRHPLPVSKLNSCLSMCTHYLKAHKVTNVIEY